MYKLLKSYLDYLLEMNNADVRIGYPFSTKVPKYLDRSNCFGTNTLFLTLTSKYHYMSLVKCTNYFISIKAIKAVIRF